MPMRDPSRLPRLGLTHRRPLILPEQLPVHGSCLACGLEPKLFIERAGEVVVAFG